jgi:hypothetical protein
MEQRIQQALEMAEQIAEANPDSPYEYDFNMLDEILATSERV